MIKFIKVVLSIGIFSAGPAFGKTTINDTEIGDRTLILDTRDEGVVKNLFDLGLSLYGPGGGGYSSMDQQVKLPKSDLISRIGRSSVFGQTPSGKIDKMGEHYQMYLHFNFVDNDYKLIRKRGQEILFVYGSVADDLIGMSFDQASGVRCRRKHVSVCAIHLD